MEDHLLHSLKDDNLPFVWQYDSRHGWFDFDAGASQQIEDVWKTKQDDPTTTCTTRRR